MYTLSAVAEGVYTLCYFVGYDKDNRLNDTNGNIVVTGANLWVPDLNDDWKTALPGLLDGTQYKWKSEKQTAPAGDFKTLRITFLENSNKKWQSSFPFVAIAEFYLYDKNGKEVELNAERFSSNATETEEGSIEKLCDGVTTGDISTYDWYWHSLWSATPNPYGFHYLEINLDGIEADLSEYSFGWVTRQKDGSPAEILVAAGASSNDVCEKTNSAMMPQLSTGGNIKPYTIRSVRSKKYIASEADNKQLIQTDNANQRSALWYFTEGTDGKVVMHNLATTQVVGNNCVMGESGEWKFLPAIYRPGVVISQNNYSGNCFDDQSGKVGTWGHSAGDNEGTTWLFKEVKGVVAVSELNGKVIESIGEPATEIESGKWYILNNVGRSNIVSQEFDNWKMRDKGNVAAGQFANDKSDYLFKITKNGDNYNIMSGNGRYFKLGNNTASSSFEPVKFTIAKIGESEDVFYLRDVESEYVADGQETNNAFVGYGKDIPANTGGNNSYKLLPVEFSVKYVYDYYMDDTKIASETFVGKEFSNLDHHYGVSSDNVPTGPAVAGVHRVDITVNLPFEYAGSVSDVTNWYFLRMHVNYPGYIQDDENDYIPYVNGNTLPANAARYNYAWAFVGNPIDGFKVVNNVTNKAIKSSGSGDATTSDVNDATVWHVKASNVKDKEGSESFFTLKYPTNDQYLNANDPNHRLQHWSKADSGSTIMLELVNDDYTYSVSDMAGNVYESQFVYGGGNYTLPVFTGAHGHSITEGVLDKDNRTYKAKINFAYPVSKVGGATNETLLNIFDEDKYIRRVGNNVKMQTAKVAAVDANCLWAIYPSFDNGAFTFAIMNIATGKYIFTEATETAHDNVNTIALNDAATMFTLPGNNAFKVSDKDLYLSINSTNNTDVYLGLWNKTHNGTTITNSMLPQYDVAVSAAKYATFYAPVAVTVPEGVTAHTVTIDGERAVLSEALEVIPAYTGVVLYSETPKTYTFAVTTSDVVIENNALCGTVAATYVAEDAYVLAVKDEKVGFYKATKNNADETAFLNNHHKAYLPMPVGAQGVAYYSFTFDFEGTTGIENVENAAAEKVIYDLTGRRVQQMNAAGIYIVNGKKVLVK